MVAAMQASALMNICIVHMLDKLFGVSYSYLKPDTETSIVALRLVNINPNIPLENFSLE